MIGMAMTGFAVDLGGTKTAAARFEAGHIVARVQRATDPALLPEAQVQAMAGLLDGLGWTSNSMLGVAVAGRVGRDGRWWAVNRSTLTTIDGVDLVALLRSHLGRGWPVNDAAAATLGEASLGAGRGVDRLAYLTVSTGVGGGLLLDGVLQSSADGLAGHLGFASSPLATGLCGSGRSATVESVAAGRAIAQAAADAGHQGMDARAVFAAADDGAAWADRIIDRSAQAIARLAADLRTMLAIDAVVLGGSIGLAPGYAGRVQAHLAQEPDLFRPALHLAALGQDSALHGALVLACERDAG